MTPELRTHDVREDPTARVCRQLARQLQETFVPLRNPRAAVDVQTRMTLMLRRELERAGLQVPRSEAAAS